MVSEVDEMLDSLKTVHAPDTRTALWDLTVSAEKGVVRLTGEVDRRENYEAVTRSVRERFPQVEMTVTLLPVEGSDRVVNGLVNNSVIHLRKRPSSKTELVTQALLGSPVRILKVRDSKALIQIPSGYLGWVNVPEVQPLDTAELARYRHAEKIIFTEQYGSVFSEPDKKSLPVADMVIGCILEVDSTSKSFLEVRYPDGRTGWVRKDQCVPLEEIFYKEPTREGLIETALQFRGIPYLWGGTSSKAIDCSGLITNVYFMNGIQLPRDASQQTLAGREITTTFSPEGLEAGDLLFFGHRATETEKENVTHVAMYMGGGEYIHSAGYRERVSINSMDSLSENFIEHYPEIFIRTVRILGESGPGFGPIPDNPMYKEIIPTSR